MDKINEQLKRLHRLYKESDGIYHSLAASFGLTDTVFWILYAVTHSGGECTQNDLCSQWNFPPQTVNSAVSKLKEQKLVTLEVIPNTKNRKNIVLTPQGSEFAGLLAKKVDSIEKNALLCFNEEERELYLSLFTRHLEYLRAEENREINE